MSPGPSASRLLVVALLLVASPARAQREELGEEQASAARRPGLRVEVGEGRAIERLAPPRLETTGLPDLAGDAFDPAGPLHEVRSMRGPGLPGQVGRDLRGLVRHESLQTLGLGLSLSFLLRPIDGDAARALSGPEELEEALGAGKVMGSAPLQLAFAVATCAYGRAAHHPEVLTLGSRLLRAQLLAQSLTFGIKRASRRLRPDSSDRHSFPSGHSATAFATATVLHESYGFKAGAPAYALAAYVAASRLADRRHFLSDVAFGAALGIVAGRTVTVGSGRRRFALQPFAAPGGGGLALVHAE